jgi:NAD-specific glutamate dehydrogenase
VPHTDSSIVKKVISAAAWIPESLIDNQTAWFYNELGIDDVYFQLEDPKVIANHITSLYAAKVAACSREDKKEEIRLDMEASDHAIYIDTSEPGRSAIDGPRYETRLEAKYLDGNDTNRRFRVETFRSPGVLGSNAGSSASLRCYFVYQCTFVDSNADPNETRLEIISDRMFLAKATKNTKQIYQEIIELAVNRTGPVIEVFDIEDSPEKRLVVAFQPHRYSRTRDQFDAFAAVLSEVDALVLSEVYPAGEAPIAGADAKSLARAIRARGRNEPVVVSQVSELSAVLPDVLQDGDLLLLMGAGDIGYVAQHLSTHGFVAGKTE